MKNYRELQFLSEGEVLDIQEGFTENEARNHARYLATQYGNIEVRNNDKRKTLMKISGAIRG